MPAAVIVSTVWSPIDRASSATVRDFVQDVFVATRHAAVVEEI